MRYAEIRVMNALGQSLLETVLKEAETTTVDNTYRFPHLKTDEELQHAIAILQTLKLVSQSPYFADGIEVRPRFSELVRGAS